MHYIKFINFRELKTSIIIVLEKKFHLNFRNGILTNDSIDDESFIKFMCENLFIMRDKSFKVMNCQYC